MKTPLLTGAVGHPPLQFGTLRLGWDYWIPCFEAGCDTVPPYRHTDGCGVARFVHPVVLGTAKLPGGTRPVLSVDMSARQIANGIYRRSLIRPGSDSEDAGDFDIGSIDAGCVSAAYLQTLLGHTPADVAQWLVQLRNDNFQLFRHVLGNDFARAFELDPELIERPWPSVVRSKRDFMPPIMAAVLYAELGRAAMNQAGLLELGTYAGEELRTKTVLDLIPTAGVAFDTPAIRRMAAHSALQTYSLADAIEPAGDVLSAEEAEQIEMAAARIVEDAAQRDKLFADKWTLEELRELKASAAQHPQFAKEPRKGQAPSLQPRKAGFFWGLTAHQNGPTRLLELALTARDWNERFRPNGEPLKSVKPRSGGSPVTRAIAAIDYRWFGEHDPRVAKARLLDKIANSAKKAELAAKPSSCFDPLFIEDYLEPCSGATLLAMASEVVPALPAKCSFGYTARSQAHLWLDNDGDDIEHFLDLHQKAETSREKVWAERMSHTSKAPQVAIKPAGQTVIHAPVASPLALASGLPSRLAQMMSHMVWFFSTDPIFARLFRERRAPFERL